MQESSDEIPSGSMPRRYTCTHVMQMRHAPFSVSYFSVSYSILHLHMLCSHTCVCACSVDIILRNEAVEKAKAGDKVSFVGSLIVLPDVAQLSGSRGRAAVVAGSQRDGYSEDGLSGLKVTSP